MIDLVLDLCLPPITDKFNPPAPTIVQPWDNGYIVTYPLHPEDNIIIQRDGDSWIIFQPLKGPDFHDDR